MHDDTCIFCRIITGAIPSVKLLENDHALAFLDIAPFEKGHALVIPKYHAATLTELPLSWLTPVIEGVQTLAHRLMSALPCDGFNVLQSNGRCATQVVPHVHFHVIPRWNGRPLTWHATAGYDSPEEMQDLAARLRL